MTWYSQHQVKWILHNALVGSLLLLLLPVSVQPVSSCMFCWEVDEQVPTFGEAYTAPGMWCEKNVSFYITGSSHLLWVNIKPLEADFQQNCKHLDLFGKQSPQSPHTWRCFSVWVQISHKLTGLGSSPRCWWSSKSYGRRTMGVWWMKWYHRSP